MTTTAAVQADRRELLLRACAAYNSQDIEALVAPVSDDVNWPDDDAGRLHGKDEVGAYWTELWARTRTHDEPVAFSERNDGRTAVQISQVVRSPNGCISHALRRHVLPPPQLIAKQLLSLSST